MDFFRLNQTRPNCEKFSLTMDNCSDPKYWIRQNTCSLTTSSPEIVTEGSQCRHHTSYFCVSHKTSWFQINYRRHFHHYRPQGKVMFSQVCDSHSVYNPPHGYSVTAHPCYGTIGTHPTGMLSCLLIFVQMWNMAVISPVGPFNWVPSETSHAWIIECVYNIFCLNAVVTLETVKNIIKMMSVWCYCEGLV